MNLLKVLVSSPLLLLAAAATTAASDYDWATVYDGPSAPQRSIVTATIDNTTLLIGPRIVSFGEKGRGTQIQIWSSADGGGSWSQRGSVASSETLIYGDAHVKLSGDVLLCAFRERDEAAKSWRVTLCRSVDLGRNWQFDSVIEESLEDDRFVGAPFLFVSPASGNLQCYFDSEKQAALRGCPGHQLIGMKERSGQGDSKRDWSSAPSWSKAVDVLDPSVQCNSSYLLRDGMATLATTAAHPTTIVVVREGVHPASPHANLITSAESHDGGMTWGHRQVVHAPQGGFNAYNPYVVAAAAPHGDGNDDDDDDDDLWVAFCTDETDFPGTVPDPSNAPVSSRRCHVKATHRVRPTRTAGATTTTATTIIDKEESVLDESRVLSNSSSPSSSPRSWSTPPSAVYSAAPHNYNVGLFVVDNTLFATVNRLSDPRGVVILRAGN